MACHLRKWRLRLQGALQGIEKGRERERHARLDFGRSIWLKRGTREPLALLKHDRAAAAHLNIAQSSRK